MSAPTAAARASTTEGAPRTSAGRHGAPLVARGLGWVVLYLLVALGPLVVAATADPPPGRDLWVQISTGLGFVGLAMLGLQFAIVSRFSTVNAPYGLDVVLQFHRQIAFVAFAFVLAHPAILVVGGFRPASILDPLSARGPAAWGLASVAALVALVVISVWRQRLRLRYEVWKVAHGLLAVVVVATALVHVERVGYYVSGPWKRGLWIAMTLAFVGLLANVRLVKPLRLLRRPWVVGAVNRETVDTVTLVLRPDGHDGIEFMPGQFAWLRVGTSPFSMEEHPFSFTSSAEHRDHVCFTIKQTGDFTGGVGDVEPGTRVYLDGPYGAFIYERNEGPAFVLVAGGVGIAPLMSMLRTLADRGDRRPIRLFYGSRDEDDIIFREELEALRTRLDLEIVHVLEAPSDAWSGERGFLTGEILDRYLPDDVERARYLLCGPPPMMDAAQDLLEERGVPPEHIDLERFNLI